MENLLKLYKCKCGKALDIDDGKICSPCYLASVRK
jgi:hypothetical protein